MRYVLMVAIVLSSAPALAQQASAPSVAPPAQGLPYTWDDVQSRSWWDELSDKDKQQVRKNFKAMGGKIPYEGTAPPTDRMVAEAARLTRFTPIGHRDHEQGGLVYHFSNAAGRVVAVRVYRLDTRRWIAERDMPMGVVAFLIYEPDR